MPLSLLPKQLAKPLPPVRLPRASRDRRFEALLMQSFTEMQARDVRH